MMKRCFALLSLLMALVFAAACSHTSAQIRTGAGASPVMDAIEERGTLVVGTAAGMPPFNMLTTDGEITGLEPDMARMMAEAMGVGIQFKTMSFAQLLPALEAGAVDMVLSSMTITPERNKKVAFVGPYFVSGKSFLTKANWLATAKDLAQVNSPQTRLTTLAGSTSLVFVQNELPDATLLPAKSYDDAVGMLIDGRADAMVADYPICLVSVFRYPKEDLVALMPPLNYEPIGVALPKGDPHLINWVTNYLNYLESSGELSGLKELWLTDGWWLDSLP